MEVTYLWPPWLSGGYHPRLMHGEVPDAVLQDVFDSVCLGMATRYGSML